MNDNNIFANKSLLYAIWICNYSNYAIVGLRKCKDLFLNYVKNRNTQSYKSCFLKFRASITQFNIFSIL